MDSQALCFSLLLCTATLGQSTPVPTDPHCTTRCSLYNKIVAATNSVDQIIDDSSRNNFGCTNEQATQCRLCMGCNKTNSQINQCTQQCEQHSSCQKHCDCSLSTLSSAINMSIVAHGQEVKLLCRDANEVGAVLFVALPYQSLLTRTQYRLQGSPLWTNLEHKPPLKWVRLENLTFSANYEVQLFSDNNTSPAAVGIFDTLSKTHKPLPVREIRVSNYVSGADGKLYANVSWIPAVDRVCCYAVYKELNYYNTCEPGQNWFTKHSVTRGAVATFMMISYTAASADSPLTRMTPFIIPQCPEHLTEPDGRPSEASTKHCSTELPGHMCSMESAGSKNQTILITVTWEAAKHIARAPPISAYRLKLYSLNRQVIDQGSVEVDQQESSFTWKALVSSLLIPNGYNLEIVSESSLGLSVPTVFRRRRLRILEGYLSSDPACAQSASWAELMSTNYVTTTTTTTEGPLTIKPINNEKMVIHHQSVPVVTASAGLVVLTVCFLVVVFMSHKKRLSIRKKREEKSFDRFNELIMKSDVGDSKVKQVSAPELLRLGHKIGEGHFGIVYKAELWKPEEKRWIVIAAKTLKGQGDAAAREQFQQESALMKEVGRHPHVVGLLGEGSLPHDGGLYMAVELCERGDLLTLLRSHYLDDRSYVNEGQLHQTSDDQATLVCNSGYGKIIDGKSPLTVIDLMSFARQVALGMEYLSSIRIVHRDLAARNVLVTADLKLKIADFGLSRDVYEGSIYFKQRGPAKLPLRWMALEAIERSMYTSASDIWSFGVLLWEIWTLGKEPYAGLTGMQVLEALKHGHRLSRPDQCPHQLYKVMLQCWSESPLSRPTFGSFRASVETMIEGNSYLAVSEAPQPNSSPSSEDMPLLSTDQSSSE